MLGVNHSLTSPNKAGTDALIRDYNFSRDKSLHQDIVHTRDTGATQTNSSGLVAYAPENGVKKSTQLDQWSKLGTDNTTVTAATDITDPLGGNGAFRVTTDTANVGGIYVDTANQVTKSDGVTVQSIYIRSVSGTKTTHAILNNTNSEGLITITEEWQRVVMPYDSTVSAPANFYAVDFRASDTDATDVYVFAPQVSSSLTGEAVEYVPTTSAFEYAPRFDYDKDGNSLGLLVEEQRDNFVPYSQDFSHADWVKTSSTIATSGETDPSGGTGAYKLTLNASDSSAKITDGWSSASGEHTFSVYVKKGTASDIRVGFNDEGVRGVTMDFNLDTGQIITSSNANNTSVQDCGNGWIRLAVTGTIDASGSDTFFLRGFTTNSNTSSGDDLHIWGAQLEAAASFCSSLIPSYGASTTVRAADLVNVTGTNFSRFFKETGGTFVADIQVQKGFVDDAASARIFSSTKNELTTDMIQLFYNHSQSYVRGAVSSENSTSIDSATNFPFPTTNDTSGGEISRHAIAYKLNSFAQAFDGDIFTDNTGNVPVGINQLNIGHHVNNGQVLTGWIRRLRYYNKRQSDTKIQSLTDTSFLLDKYKGAKAAHSLRSLRDGRDSTPVARVRRDYDSYEADYTAAQISDGSLSNDHTSSKQTVLPLDVSCDAVEMVVGGDFTEMAVNGDFTTDTTGWAAGGSAAIAISSNRLQITSSGSGNGYASQTLTTQIGKSYTVTADYIDDTGGNALIRVGTSSGGNENGDTTFTATGTYTLTFTATATTTYLRIGANEASASLVYLFDNVSVVEGAWTHSPAGDNSYSISGGGVNYDDVSSGHRFYQNVSLKKGKSYTLEFSITNTASSSYAARMWIGNSAGSYNYTSDGGYINFSEGHHSLTLIMASDESEIAFWGHPDGSVFRIDNISLTEKAPLATGFSTRKINSSYTGKAMRCRNQSNVEVEVGFDDNDEISLLSPITNTSQNILNFSESFGSLQAVPTTLKGGQADPFGGNNAYECISDGLWATATLTSGYSTFSLYAKKGTADFLVLRTQNIDSGGMARTWFNLSTGVVGSCDTGTNHAGAIEAVTGYDGWYRCRITFKTTSDLTCNPSFYSAETDTGAESSTKSIFAFGAQMEDTLYEDTGTDLTINGDFEIDDNWDQFGSPDTQEQSTEQVRSGTYSWKVSSSATRKGIQSEQLETAINLTAGNKYRVSAWIYAVDGATVESGISNTDKSIFTEYSVTQGQWTNITYDTIATSSTWYTYIGFFTKDAKTFYVDDVTITELPTKLSNYSQTPAIADDDSSTTETTLGGFSGLENLVAYSSTLMGTGWSNSANEVVSSGHTDPFGGTTAVLQGATGTDPYTIKTDCNVVAGQKYVFSIYMKGKGSTIGKTCKLQIWFGVGTATGPTTYDNSYELTDEWQRFELEGTPTGSGTVALRIDPPDTAVVDDEVYISSPQLNINSAKTYVETVGDNPLTGDVNVVNWYDQAGGEDFVNATAAYQPRIVMGSELVTDSGGKASVFFDGGDNLINATLAGQNRLDAYLTIEPDTAARTEGVLLSGNDAAKYGLIYDDAHTSQTINDAFGTPSEFINGSQLASSATRNDTHDGLQNTSVFSVTEGSTSSFTTFQMGWNNSGGSSFNYIGKLSEMVFFPNMDSSPKRFPIEQNMLRHYNIYDHKSEFNTDMATWGGDGSSGWYNITNPSYTSIVNGEAILDGSQGTSDARTHVDVTVGKYYEISVDMRTDSTSESGNAKLYMSDGSNYSYAFGNFDATNTMTTYSKIVQPTQSQIRLYPYNTKNDKTYYDNITVREVGAGGFVTKLFDQTGNNLTLSASVAAYQPKIVEGGDVLTLNSKPTMRFNGISSGASHLTSGVIGPAMTQPNTITLVIRPDSETGDGYITDAGIDGTGTAGRQIIAINADGAVKTFAGAWANTTASASITVASLVWAYFHGSSSIVDLNGTVDPSTETPSSGVLTSLGLGARMNNTSTYGGDISEIIIWDSSQESIKADIKVNINTHYTIY